MIFGRRQPLTPIDYLNPETDAPDGRAVIRTRNGCSGLVQSPERWRPEDRVTRSDPSACGRDNL